MLFSSANYMNLVEAHADRRLDSMAFLVHAPKASSLTQKPQLTGLLCLNLPAAAAIVSSPAGSPACVARLEDQEVKIRTSKSHTFLCVILWKL